MLDKNRFALTISLPLILFLSVLFTNGSQATDRSQLEPALRSDPILIQLSQPADPTSAPPSEEGYQKTLLTMREMLMRVLAEVKELEGQVTEIEKLLRHLWLLKPEDLPPSEKPPGHTGSQARTPSPSKPHSVVSLYSSEKTGLRAARVSRTGTSQDLRTTRKWLLQQLAEIERELEQLQELRRRKSFPDPPD